MMSFRIARRVGRLVNRLIRPIGLKVVRADREPKLDPKEQAEVARLRKLQERDHWGTPRYTEGLQFNRENYLRFLEQVCLPYKAEYDALPREKDDTDSFYLNNGYFGPADAEVLYCVIRHFKPARIIEIGSGNSTRLMRKAIDDGKLQTKLVCVDPHPRIDIHDHADEHVPLPVEEVEVETITDALTANDILFIDSSHTVVTGGDGPYLYLEVLPKLRPGVLVHVHDIFFPFDYPQAWIVKSRRPFTEQYLLHAFLWDSTAFEILWPANYMWQYAKEDVLAAFPSSAHSIHTASLWVSRTGSATGNL